jgi:hypothetical protein
MFQQPLHKSARFGRLVRYSRDMVAVGMSHSGRVESPLAGLRLAKRNAVMVLCFWKKLFNIRIMVEKSMSRLGSGGRPGVLTDSCHAHPRQSITTEELANLFAADLDASNDWTQRRCQAKTTRRTHLHLIAA